MADRSPTKIDETIYRKGRKGELVPSGATMRRGPASQKKLACPACSTPEKPRFAVVDARLVGGVSCPHCRHRFRA